MVSKSQKIIIFFLYKFSCDVQGLSAELQALVTTPSVQEKLYTAGKCIATQTLAKTLADDHQGTKN